MTLLLVYHDNSMVKIEPNFISRGTVYPVISGCLSKGVNEKFGVFLDKVPMRAPSDLYASKICAALNRQHPRDLFDIKLLMETTGITDDIRQAFVIYLAGDVRPMFELLSPNSIDIEGVFKREFLRMTEHKITLDDLIDVRNMLIKIINQTLTDHERYFLISVKQGEPRYDLMPFDHLSQLPAIKWKLLNLKKMDVNKHQVMLAKLRDKLGV